eukprot:776692_1
MHVAYKLGRRSANPNLNITQKQKLRENADKEAVRVFKKVTPPCFNLRDDLSQNHLKLRDAKKFEWDMMVSMLFDPRYVDGLSYAVNCMAPYSAGSAKNLSVAVMGLALSGLCSVRMPEPKCELRCRVAEEDIMSEKYRFHSNCDLRGELSTECTVRCHDGFHLEDGKDPTAMCGLDGRFWITGCLPNKCVPTEDVGYPPCHDTKCTGKCLPGYGHGPARALCTEHNGEYERFGCDEICTMPSIIGTNPTLEPDAGFGPGAEMFFTCLPGLFFDSNLTNITRYSCVKQGYGSKWEPALSDGCKPVCSYADLDPTGLHTGDLKFAMAGTVWVATCPTGKVFGTTGRSSQKIECVRNGMNAAWAAD